MNSELRQQKKPLELLKPRSMIPTNMVYEKRCLSARNSRHLNNNNVKVPDSNLFNSQASDTKPKAPHHKKKRSLS